MIKHINRDVMTWYWMKARELIYVHDSLVYCRELLILRLDMYNLMNGHVMISQHVYISWYGKWEIYIIHNNSIIQRDNVFIDVPVTLLQ